MKEKFLGLGIYIFYLKFQAIKSGEVVLCMVIQPRNACEVSDPNGALGLAWQNDPAFDTAFLKCGPHIPFDM